MQRLAIGVVLLKVGIVDIVFQQCSLLVFPERKAIENKFQWVQ